jgi:hypothetical protein
LRPTTVVHYLRVCVLEVSAGGWTGGAMRPWLTRLLSLPVAARLDEWNDEALAYQVALDPRRRTSRSLAPEVQVLWLTS